MLALSPALEVCEPPGGTAFGFRGLWVSARESHRAHCSETWFLNSTSLRFFSTCVTHTVSLRNGQFQNRLVVESPSFQLNVSARCWEEGKSPSCTWSNSSLDGGRGRWGGRGGRGAEGGGGGPRAGGWGRRSQLRPLEPAVLRADSLRPAAPAPRGRPAPLCAGSLTPLHTPERRRDSHTRFPVRVVGARRRKVGTCQGDHPALREASSGQESRRVAPLCEASRSGVSCSAPLLGAVCGAHTPRSSRGTRRGPEKVSVLCQEPQKASRPCKGRVGTFYNVTKKGISHLEKARWDVKPSEEKLSQGQLPDFSVNLPF